MEPTRSQNITVSWRRSPGDSFNLLGSDIGRASNIVDHTGLLAKLGDGLREPPARTQRQAQLAQVVFAERAQDVEVDLVLHENPRVAVEPDLGQPGGKGLHAALDSHGSENPGCTRVASSTVRPVQRV